MVQMSATAMGIDPFTDPRPLTQTGGLVFFGGPGNNYSTHGIASMVDRLRAEAASASSPPTAGSRRSTRWASTRALPRRRRSGRRLPQAELNATPRTKLVDEYDGAGTLETFVVMHERDGSPAMGIVAVRTPDGGRTWASSTDADAAGVARVR